MSKTNVVSKTTATIQAATGFDARHLPDVEKAIGEAYEAGAAGAHPTVVVSPLSDAEILLFRATVRDRIATPAKPAKAAKKK